MCVTVLHILYAGGENICGIFASSLWCWLGDPASLHSYRALNLNFQFQFVTTAGYHCRKT